MEPEEWGPGFWRTLHTISFYYPDSPTQEERKAAKNFFYSLAYLLPCDECAQEYSKMLANNPIEGAMVGRQELSLWVYKLHSIVNKRLGKTRQPSYAEVRADYLKLKPRYKISPIAQRHQEISALQREIDARRAQFTQLSLPISNNTPFLPPRGGRQISNPGVGVTKPPCKDCARKRLARGHFPK